MKNSIILKDGNVLPIATAIAILIAMICCKKTPTAPSPIPQSITVTSTSDLYYIGDSETFSATVTMSDGSIKAVVGGTWSSDTPSVAKAESSMGLVTIVGSGEVTIIVRYQGLQGAKLIRGLPNYQGTWSGSYHIVSCSDSGHLRGACADFLNYIFPIDLNLIQDRDRVTGKFWLGSLSGDASGPVQMDGQLVLSGKIAYDIWSIDVSWRMQSATPGKITGNLNMLWRAAGYSGEIRISANIRDLNRTSSMGISVDFGLPLASKPTLRALVQAMTER